MEGIIHDILLGSNELELQNDGIRSQIRGGQYDLLGPHGEIILPKVWDTVIQPDWTITMHMWPRTGDTEEDTRKAREAGARSIATKRNIPPFSLVSMSSSNRFTLRILTENRGGCPDRKKC